MLLAGQGESFGQGVEQLAELECAQHVIALWLGHESVTTTQIYVHADLALKEQALARTAPLQSTPGRYQPSDTILTFLNGL